MPENRPEPTAVADEWSTLLQRKRDTADKEASLYAGDAEHNRTLHPAVARAILEAGYARHFVPGQWGGRSGGFAELLSAAAALAEQCPSAGWCAALQAAHGRLAAHLPEQGRKELWSGSPDIPIAAAIGLCSAQLTRVPEGWQLSGRWDMASAVDHAEWVLLAAAEPGDGDRPGWILAVPRADITVHDTWNSAGLRGTGSHSLSVAGAFVPDHRAVLRASVERGLEDPGADRCHRVPAFLVASLIFAAPALGAARGALGVWVRSARSRTDASGRPVLLDSGFQQTLACTSAKIDAAQLLLERSARRADQDPSQSPPVALNLRDCAVAVDMLVEAVERLYRSGGARAQGQDSDLQRYWRDIHAIAAHAALQPAPAAAAYAAYTLGS